VELLEETSSFHRGTVKHFCVSMYVYMYVCMYVCMYACMYVNDMMTF